MHSTFTAHGKYAVVSIVRRNTEFIFKQKLLYSMDQNLTMINEQFPHITFSLTEHLLPMWPLEGNVGVPFRLLKGVLYTDHSQCSQKSLTTFALNLSTCLIVQQYLLIIIHLTHTCAFFLELLCMFTMHSSDITCLKCCETIIVTQHAVIL